ANGFQEVPTIEANVVVGFAIRAHTFFRFHADLPRERTGKPQESENFLQGNSAAAGMPVGNGKFAKLNQGTRDGQTLSAHTGLSPIVAAESSRVETSWIRLRPAFSRRLACSASAPRGVGPGIRPPSAKASREWGCSLPRGSPGPSFPRPRSRP